MWQVSAMDDKELIKRIMEEVKDEKLREELLALVAEKNRRQSEAKQEEEKLINHKTRHGILSKVGWGIVGIFYIFAIFFIFLAFGPLAAFAVAILAALARIIYLIKETRKK
jgi:Flp pilus assembly protein TadB